MSRYIFGEDFAWSLVESASRRETFQTAEAQISEFKRVYSFSGQLSHDFLYGTVPPDHQSVINGIRCFLMQLFLPFSRDLFSFTILTYKDRSALSLPTG
jgi:hypothetical protein